MQTLDRTGNNLLMKKKIPIKMIKCNLIISIIIQAVSKIYYSNLKNQNLFHQSSLLNKLPYIISRKLIIFYFLDILFSNLEKRKLRNLRFGKCSTLNSYRLSTMIAFIYAHAQIPFSVFCVFFT